MKNKTILLLSMIVLFLSFFVFTGNNQITGHQFINGVVVPSFVEEKPEINLHPRVTALYVDKEKVFRGGSTVVYVVPGASGVMSRVGVYTSDGVLLQYLYLCGYMKICTSPKHLPVTISKAFRRGVIELRFYDLSLHSSVATRLTVL